MIRALRGRISTLAGVPAARRAVRLGNRALALCYSPSSFFSLAPEIWPSLTTDFANDVSLVKLSASVPVSSTRSHEHWHAFAMRSILVHAGVSGQTVDGAALEQRQASVTDYATRNRRAPS